jgi:hypothetical protein
MAPMTEAIDSLVIQSVESALNAKHGITGYLVVNRHRGVVASSFAPEVDIKPITVLCNDVFTKGLHKLNPNCHLQTTLVVPETGVFHLQHMTNYALVVLTPISAPVDLSALVRMMEEHLIALERQ